MPRVFNAFLKPFGNCHLLDSIELIQSFCVQFKFPFCYIMKKDCILTIFKGFNDFIRFCIFLYLSFMFIKAVFNRVDDVDDKKGRQKSNHHNPHLIVI